MLQPPALPTLTAFLVNSIENARASEVPFYHLQFDRVFPDDVYAAMLREMPQSSDYRALPGRNKGNIQADGTSIVRSETAIRQDGGS